MVDRNLVEQMAKEVYCAMAWAYTDGSGNHAPLWVEGGNSHAQEEARRAARAALDRLHSKEPKSD